MRLPGETLAAGAVPVPERLKGLQLLKRASLILSEAVRLPLADGAKVMLIVHLVPAARELPQVFVWAKLEALAPVSVMEVMRKAALPELVTETVSGPLVVPTA